jgi:hypothetical protein
MIHAGLILVSSLSATLSHMPRPPCLHRQPMYHTWNCIYTEGPALYDAPDMLCILWCSNNKNFSYAVHLSCYYHAKNNTQSHIPNVEILHKKHMCHTPLVTASPSPTLHSPAIRSNLYILGEKSQWYMLKSILSFKESYPKLSATGANALNK